MLNSLHLIKSTARLRGKMAASLLRIGRLGCVKCLQAESWSTLRRAPAAAAFSTKSDGSKKSTKKKNSGKDQAKTFFDLEKLVQHKSYDLPKKEVSPAAAVAAAEAVANAAAEELVDPAPVVAEAAGEELRVEAPAEPVEPFKAQMDPIQKLFLDSIREYSSKSQAAEGLVDAGSDYEKAWADEVSKLERLYGGGDLTSFPEFIFTEPKFDEVAQK
ncbi:hypothetical protein CgunFtcFv8_025173 [Champsocephalus gunnari]|uniref:ATP synthase peripheral stalk subunit F6, mitochondrial n=1 Tax=Champsocephalus gunnari TaxID=52237 RepID=A0AAN8DI33_CHAGU|nr:hypothetical protein CgunFtcFv8_025173 [Champsocephalus gunnari]